MSQLHQPIFAGLIVSTIIVVSMVFWGLSGGLIARRDGVHDQYLALIDQRGDLLRQLSDFDSQEMCTVPEVTIQTPADFLPPHKYDGMLDASVVWILAPGSQGIATGSGFFVSNTQILTNLHVVEAVEPLDKIHVAARGYGIIAGSVSYAGNSNLGSQDLALITLDDPVEWAQPLNIDGTSTADLRLRNVIAAGFPGAVIDSYGSIDDMITGDALDLPQLVLTAGMISSDAENQNGVQIISHTAQISHGNSGGPLVDSCGAVIGVNTYIYSDSGGVRMFAIGQKTLKEFLLNNGISYLVSDEKCN